MATPPAVMSPVGICNHPVIGMTNVALPTPTSVRYVPVKWPTGGGAAFPSRNSRSCSIPDRPRRCGGKVSPRTGSSQISPPKIAPLASKIAPLASIDIPDSPDHTMMMLPDAWYPPPVLPGATHCRVGARLRGSFLSTDRQTARSILLHNDEIRWIRLRISHVG